MSRVDIIIPLYNKADTIERTIRSILNQTYTDWSVIIVDDGSTDGSADCVKPFLSEKIQLIRQDNRGPGAARNRGIADSAAPYLAFLDADDEWYPWYLENAVKAIEHHPVSLVGSMYDEWPRQQDMTGYWKRQGVVPGVYKLTGKESPYFAEALMLFFHVGASLVRCETARQYGGYYEENRCSFGEDTVFFSRLVFNEPVMVIGPSAVRHNRQDSDLSHTHDRPLVPILEDPSVLLDTCPEYLHDLAMRALACLALRTAHHKARNGFKDTAKQLLEKFPESRQFKKLYIKCRIEIFLSPILPWWVRLKCAVGPQIRRLYRKIFHKANLPFNSSNFS